MNSRQRNAVFALYRTLLRRRWHRLGPVMKGEAVEPGEVSRWLLIPNLVLPPGWLAYGAT